MWLTFSEGTVWETFLFLISVKDQDHETSYKSINWWEKTGKVVCAQHEAETAVNDLDLLVQGFSGAVVKNPPANAGDMGLSPGLGRSHMSWSN